MAEMNDHEFSVVIPKYDNSERKIRTDEIEDVAVELSERFGGVTVHPSVLGCWKPEDQSGLVCEENIVMQSVRDSNDDVSVERDTRFMENLGEQVGDEFGQAAVMVSSDVVEVDFVSGDYKDELGGDKVGRQPFNELV